MKNNQNEKEIINKLEEIIKPGDTIYTVNVHTSSSGLSRVIKLLVIKDNTIMPISYLASQLLEGYNKKHHGCNIHGVGLDVGFDLVYRLSRILFNDDYVLKQRWL